MPTERRPVLIVTGLSGAGMSSSLKHLEDLGYEVFDNFPPALAGALLADRDAGDAPVAIGLDARTRGFDPDAVIALARSLEARLVFVTADEAVLQARFTETRRRHPLAGDRPASAGIRREQEWLYTLRGQADEVIDTSALSIHDLRHVIETRFGAAAGGRLTVTMMSFGYKYGTPREADIVMDVRFLRNPHWVPELKPLTGRDAPVAAYVAADPSCGPFLERFGNLVGPLLPHYAHEGKSYLTVAVGCTGGRHRSVYVVERLRAWLEETGHTPHILHRDADR